MTIWYIGLANIMENLGGGSSDAAIRGREQRWGVTLGLGERKQHKEVDVK
jgi:hypothetical protein